MGGASIVYIGHGLPQVLHISQEVVGVLTGSLGVTGRLGTVGVIAIIAGDNVNVGITALVGT